LYDKLDRTLTMLELAFQYCMLCLNLVVTDYADNGHSIERSKRLGNFLALLLKLLLAEIAPGLEIIGVIVVFDDSNRSRVLLQKMLADDD